MDERYLSESSVIHAIGDIHPLDYNGQGIVERIKAIPAADVRPTNPAEWIEDGYQGLPCVCSYCGEPGKREWHFCPYCGATMKVAQDPAPDPKSTFYDLLYEEGGANTT